MADLDQHQQQAIIRDRFTRTAEVFGNAVMQTRAVEAEILAEMVAAKKTDWAVDLACGTGALAVAFAQHVRWIMGLDLTPAMLAVAQRTAREANARNIAFALGNAQDIPFPDESLDLALSSYALHHVPEPGRVIGEMARVLKRGGRAGIIDIFVPGRSAQRRNARPYRARSRPFPRANPGAQRVRFALRSKSLAHHRPARGGAPGYI